MSEDKNTSWGLLLVVIFVGWLCYSFGSNSRQEEIDYLESEVAEQSNLLDEYRDCRSYYDRILEDINSEYSFTSPSEYRDLLGLYEKVGEWYADIPCSAE